MNVWSGVFALNGESRLRGLQLVDPSSCWQSDISRDSILCLRSFVTPSSIPFYARVGPNLELHCNDPETSRWLKNTLLDAVWLEEEELDCFKTIQCPVGLLISVGSALPAKASGTTTTDLLIYGVLSSGVSINRPPTPPTSSSASSDDRLPLVPNKQLRIYAVPLAGYLATKAQAIPSADKANELSNEGRCARFLPDIRSPSPKRKRVATLFESVAQHHKRVRQRGGEAVSQLMAHSISQSAQQMHTLRAKGEPEDLSLPVFDRVAPYRSRSLSVGASLHPGKPLDVHTDSSRPSSNRSLARDFASRKNTPNPLIGSSSRKEREISPTLPSSGRKVETSHKDHEGIIADNKNTITRTILTCMRLYGFNRPSTRSGISSKAYLTTQEMAPSHGDDRNDCIAADAMPQTTTVNRDEDDFKAMYHATYRASTFALRKYLKEPTTVASGPIPLPPQLEKGKAMACIDELLRLFCEET